MQKVLIKGRSILKGFSTVYNSIVVKGCRFVAWRVAAKFNWTLRKIQACPHKFLCLQDIVCACQSFPTPFFFVLCNFGYWVRVQVISVHFFLLISNSVYFLLELTKWIVSCDQIATEWAKKCKYFFEQIVWFLKKILCKKEESGFCKISFW